MTAAITVLALHSFRNEARAADSGSGSDVLISKTFDYTGGEGGFATRASAVSAYVRAVVAGRIPKITEQKGPKGNKVSPTPSPLKVPNPFVLTPEFIETVDGWSWKTSGVVIHYYLVDPPSPQP